MEYSIAKPSILFSNLVKHYWTIENCFPAGTEHIQRIVPNGLFEIIFYLGDKPESIDRSKSMNDTTLITGQLNSYYDIKITGRLTLFSIIFQPHGLSMFFDIPLSEFFNQNVPLKFVLNDTPVE